MVENLTRRRFLWLVALSSAATACRKCDTNHQSTTNTPGKEIDLNGAELLAGELETLSEENEAFVLKLVELTAAFLDVKSHDGAAILNDVRAKCSSPPSYATTIDQCRLQVTLPPRFDEGWIAKSPPVFRKYLLLELAVLVMLRNGFRDFNLRRVNGVAGGSWHDPTSGSFETSRMKE